jgi:hypothetical protein
MAAHGISSQPHPLDCGQLGAGGHVRRERLRMRLERTLDREIRRYPDQIDFALNFGQVDHDAAMALDLGRTVVVAGNLGRQPVQIGVEAVEAETLVGREPLFQLLERHGGVDFGETSLAHERRARELAGLAPLRDARSVDVAASGKF